MSNLPNPRIGEDYIKLRKRIDVIGRKHLIRKSSTAANKPGQSDHQRTEILRSRNLTLSKQGYGYSRTVKEKLLLKTQNKNCDLVDPAKSNDSLLKIQSQRLCLKKNHEMLGSILNPVRLSRELKYRKKWPEPGYERPTWEMFKWDTPKVNLEDNVESLTRESSKCVVEYAKSLKELCDILMFCECSKTQIPIVEENLEGIYHEDNSNDVLWLQDDNNLESLIFERESKLENIGVGYSHMQIESQELYNQSTSNSLVPNSESDNESVMIIDADSQSPKSSVSHIDQGPLEIRGISLNENRYLNTMSTSCNFLNNQSDMSNIDVQLDFPSSATLETSTVPVNQLAGLENHNVNKYYADLFVQKSSEWNEYYSSNLLLLKGDETMVATAKFAEGKVVLHCIKSDFGENQVSWNKDETITLYSDKPAKVANEIEVETGQSTRESSPQSSRSSSSSRSSYSCQRSSCSASSDFSLSLSSSSSLFIVENDHSLSNPEKETCFMTSCFLHNMTATDIDLHRTLEETRKSFNELIVSTLVLHSMLSGQSQKELADELM